MRLEDESKIVPAIRITDTTNIIKEAAFVDPKKKYNMCSRCVMDTTDPKIYFNSKNECSHCQYFDKFISEKIFENKNRYKEIKKIIKQIKSYGRNKKYDCIIGLSGGADSSFVAYKIHNWGLNPLVVHVDAGWNSELAVKNIENICKKLKLDLVTHIVNWEDIKNLQIAFLKSGVINQDTPQDHAYFAALYHYAVKSNIKYIISGGNFATESILPTAWGYDAMDATHIKYISKTFSKEKLNNFPIINFFSYFINYPFLRKMKVIRPLDYINYNKEEAIKTLQREFDWKSYSGKHYESQWTKFFQGYYLPYKFGYDKRKAHLSSLILSNQISREDAIKELKRCIYQDKNLIDEKEFIAKKLNINLSELDNLLNNNCVDYSLYPNHQKKLKRFKRLKRFIILINNKIKNLIISYKCLVKDSLYTFKS